MTMLKTYRRRARTKHYWATRSRFWIFPQAWRELQLTIASIDLAAYPNWTNYTFTYDPDMKWPTKEELKAICDRTDFTKPLPPLEIPKP